MKEKIKQVLTAMAIRAYDRILVRHMPDVFMTRSKIDILATKMRDQNATIESQREEFTKYAMRTMVTKTYYKEESGNIITQYTTNLPQLVKQSLRNISPSTKLKIKYSNSLYRLMTAACSSSENRLKNHGFDLNDVVTLQEAVCAIYRCNGHDPQKKFFHYLKDIDNGFVCNDCYNCYNDIRTGCKLYVSDLQRHRN